MRERSFYYDKLTTIEDILTQERENRQLMPTEENIFYVLYSKDGLNSCDSDEGVDDNEQL